MWLFALFLAVPLIEIALFIQVGGWIGLWPTLLIVIVTAVVGTALVRSRGAHAIEELRQSFRDLRDPSEPLAKGAMVLFAGALLLTPGFFTDASVMPASKSATGYVASTALNSSGARVSTPEGVAVDPCSPLFSSGRASFVSGAVAAPLSGAALSC